LYLWTFYITDDLVEDFFIGLDFTNHYRAITDRGEKTFTIRHQHNKEVIWYKEEDHYIRIDQDLILAPRSESTVRIIMKTNEKTVFLNNFPNSPYKIARGITDSNRMIFITNLSRHQIVLQKGSIVGTWEKYVQSEEEDLQVLFENDDQEIIINPNLTEKQKQKLSIRTR
jgi:hypothetical protein